MPVIVDDFCQDTSGAGEPTNDLIDWRQRYEGVLTVAYLDGKAVAGISGPWPVNQFALTWWDRPVPARQLELFDSLEAAQARVEEWAWRMRTIGVIERFIPLAFSHAKDGPAGPDSRDFGSCFFGFAEELLGVVGPAQGDETSGSLGEEKSGLPTLPCERPSLGEIRHWGVGIHAAAENDTGVIDPNRAEIASLEKVIEERAEGSGIA